MGVSFLRGPSNKSLFDLGFPKKTTTKRDHHKKTPPQLFFGLQVLQGRFRYFAPSRGAALQMQQLDFARVPFGTSVFEPGQPGCVPEALCWLRWCRGRPGLQPERHVGGHFPRRSPAPLHCWHRSRGADSHVCFHCPHGRASDWEPWLFISR